MFKSQPRGNLGLFIAFFQKMEIYCIFSNITNTGRILRITKRINRAIIRITQQLYGDII